MVPLKISKILKSSLVIGQKGVTLSISMTLIGQEVSLNNSTVISRIEVCHALVGF